LSIEKEFLMNYTLSAKQSTETKRKVSKQASLTSQQLHSMQIQLPILESTKKGKLNLPISKEEYSELIRKEEFHFGFATRPKVPRTPN
jgi:hypothetical protein